MGKLYFPAFEALVKWGGAASIPTLMEHCFSQNSDIARAVAVALVAIGPESADAVVVHFNSLEPEIRSNARTVLEAFEDVDGIIVEQCVKDLNYGRNRVAGEAMEWLSSCDVLDDKADEVPPALAAYLLRSKLRRENRDVAPKISSSDESD